MNAPQDAPGTTPPGPHPAPRDQPKNDLGRFPEGIRGCLWCGTGFRVYSRLPKRHRFCSDRCRGAYHRHTPEARQSERLHRAALRILGRLQVGPATNAELLQVGGFRFGARLHELRQAGHKIRTAEYKATGLAVYTLEAPE